jgi:enoyl-CoA hydratase/carnithine racemase
MAIQAHEGLHVDVEEGVAFVTLDHPPVNLFDAVLIGSLWGLAGELADDDEVRAIVVRSADPEFFIAHADLALIQALPRDRRDRPEQLEFIHVFMERWRTLPQVTIAQLEGRARGGGSEFALSLDLRFGAVGRAILGQPEVAVGILPGGSGTQRLPRLMGRGRALEVVLGCDDFDAELAERYGYINRALPARELGPFVDRLARRIAGFPADAVRLAKRAVDAAGGALHDGLLEEAHCFNLTLADPELDARMEGAMAAGAQTRDGELDLPGLIERSSRPGSAG